MTRQELDALRAEYLTLVPEDFIRGAFISKENLRALLNKKRDCSGLFFYIIPDKSSNSAKFTMHVEPFDANKQRYEEEVIIDSGERGLDEAATFFAPCPPVQNCP
jgi:hypothetical protein